MKFIFLVAAGVLTVNAERAEASEVRIGFRDRCTGEAAAVHTPNGSTLVIQAEELQPQMPFVAHVSVFPLNQPASPLRIEFERRFDHAGEDGKISFQSPIALPALDYTGRQSRVWTALVNWRQADLPGYSGKAQSSIYLLMSLSQRFYRVQGSAVCQRHSGAEIASPYYFNSNTVDLSITSDEVLDTTNPQRGLPFYAPYQVAAVNGAVPPLMSSPDMNPEAGDGWYFSRWQTAYGTGTARYFAKRSWTLPTQGGGYLVRHTQSSYFRAQEYALEWQAGCYRWRAGSVGHLEVTRAVKDFVYVPAALQNDPAAIHTIDAQTQLDSCGTRFTNSFQERYRVPYTEGQPLFFSPL
jgi:hypothetical protein